LINLLFGQFKSSFRHIFDPCERGFVNQLIINMFTKILPDREYVAECGQKFGEIYFITDGIVSVHSEIEQKDSDNRYAFQVLPTNSMFGDFSLLYKV
jgi:hypothetical protein